MIDVDFLSQLKLFSLIVKKRITSSFAGEKKSFYTGQGLVFNDYRQYSPGDDFRTIDWNIYARTDELLTDIFAECINPPTEYALLYVPFANVAPVNM